MSEHVVIPFPPRCVGIGAPTAATAVEVEMSGYTISLSPERDYLVVRGPYHYAVRRAMLPVATWCRPVVGAWNVPLTGGGLAGLDGAMRRLAAEWGIYFAWTTEALEALSAPGADREGAA